MYIPHIVENQKEVTMISSPEASCELTLLSDVRYLVNNVWTNSKVENVTIYDTSNISKILSKFK